MKRCDLSRSTDARAHKSSCYHPPMRTAPIYVELRIRAPFDALWEHTQNPDLHQRWDLRFSRITYLPKDIADEPQRFTYETRIGFGMRVQGTGESVGTHDTPTESTSALKFASDDPKAIIREGSGYWKYIRTDDGIRFLTLYDYKARYGTLGLLFDRFIFRPILGWATAWSFDRLRLWLERGIDPAGSAMRAIVHSICRLTLAFIWIWHGLVPKIIVRHPGEIAPLEQAGLFPGYETEVVIAIGVGESLLGLAHLIFWNARWMYAFDVVVFAALGIGAIFTIPELALQPFNPLSFTTVLCALAIIGWFVCRDVPRARRCLRTQPGRAP